MLLLLLLSLLLCGRCGGGPLVATHGGRQAALPAGRQVAPSQQILGELQYLFQQAAAGHQAAEYGAPRDDLDQMVSGLGQLASVVPFGQPPPPPASSGLANITTRQPPDVPMIDPGLFVIQGVRTCGAGAGYCMLGYNCSADTDFVDDESGHCDGLRTAFTPSADFACCRFDAEGRRTATPRPTPTTTEGTTFDDGLVDSIVNFGDEMPEEPQGENSQIVDIVAIITDSTGIVDIVTRPYTGPWPPQEEQESGAVTLPFAKPGETFAPGSMVGLGQNNVNLGTTPAAPAAGEDAFQAGDLPPPEEAAAAAGPGHLLTTAATTPASVVSSTPTGAPSTAAAEPLPQQLGPLAGVPVMDLDQDYIGDVDYDQHLLPALMPIRPGTKAGGVEAALEGSGDAPAVGDELLLAADAEGSGFGDALAVAVGAAPEGAGDSAGTVGADAVDAPPAERATPAAEPATTEEPTAGASHATTEEVKQASSAAGTHVTAPPQKDDKRPGAAAGQSAELEDSKAGSESERLPGAEPEPPAAAPAAAPGVASAPEPALGSLSTAVRPPVCGMMGSSLASLLARSRYRHRSPGGTARITGGEVTSTVVWCWMAAIMRRTRDPERPYSFVCAGTLVERDLVVTTASCASKLFQEPLRDFVVLLGASNLRANLEFGVQHLDLEEIIIHEDYQMADGVHANDIGLVKLTRQATLARTVCLLCLPPEGMELTARQSCSVTGYGLSDGRQAAPPPAARQDAPEPDGVLRQTAMSVLPRSACSAVQRLALDQSAFLCAGGQASADACYISRDGGSPLACMAASGRYYLYGVVSWDDGCDLGGQPQAYTSVANYFTWIRRNYERMTARFRVRAEG